MLLKTLACYRSNMTCTIVFTLLLFVDTKANTTRNRIVRMRAPATYRDKALKQHKAECVRMPFKTLARYRSDAQHDRIYVFAVRGYEGKHYAQSNSTHTRARSRQT